jgi:hypothetical protein
MQEDKAVGIARLKQKINNWVSLVINSDGVARTALKYGVSQNYAVIVPSVEEHVGAKRGWR